MPNINDLKKNNVTINVNRRTAKSNEEVSIDLTSPDKIKESIVKNEEVYNNSPKGKTVINGPESVTGPDGKVYARTTSETASSSGDRVAFDLTKLPKAKEQSDLVHESIEQDILSGKNPILYDYMKEKAAEMEQWVADKEDERQLQEANNQQQEEVTIDLTQPAKVETKEEPTEDVLSFDKFETGNEERDENAVYHFAQVDLGDLGDTTMEEERKAIDPVEKREEQMVDLTPETPVIEVNSITEEDTSDEVKEEYGDDKNIADLDNPEEVSDEVEEIDLNATDKLEQKVERTKVKETSELDNYVSADGIEFQNEDSIEGEKINIEIEDEAPASSDPTDPANFDEGTKHIIEQATRVLKPAAKKLDISSFTVVKKPGTNTKFLEQKQITVAKWVLRTKKVCVHMKAPQGSILEELSGLMRNASVASDYIRMYRIIYDHIVSPKPNSFEAWCKSTYTDDIDDYFFCFYIASYLNSNYLPYDCPNDSCKPGTFLSDNIPIMDMVKFGSDKDKAEFNEIYKSEVFENNPDGLYPVERVPFSDKIAISFKETTLYSYVESQSVRNNDSFVEKYKNTIGITPNIDEIFMIDLENQQLVPVNYKEYPDSKANTYKSKIQKYDSVLNTLNPDEYGTLVSYVNNFNTDRNGQLNIKYIRPAAVCPNCGAKIEEMEAGAQTLVFIRYQLGQMVNIATK